MTLRQLSEKSDKSVSLFSLNLLTYLQNILLIMYNLLFFERKIKKQQRNHFLTPLLFFLYPIFMSPCCLQHIESASDQSRA